MVVEQLRASYRRQGIGVRKAMAERAKAKGKAARRRVFKGLSRRHHPRNIRPCAARKGVREGRSGVARPSGHVWVGRHWDARSSL